MGGSGSFFFFFFLVDRGFDIRIGWLEGGFLFFWDSLGRNGCWVI